ncbi:MAG TPA: UDP-N-acetylglucosamine--N-acetylmuramyl-(pentapeptide) pyrophosphoryl-undecaprenol N-acetylglucosamine transferase [Methylomirabilota bacterium]|nr:UDP-N-acetylglucosamine--N-acetylmuramyl-(pentapeptide) pyrophosphoryl-undecaprenol N-acetylglucosamine transferase [Methylomirabilota bacterium]
MRHRPRPATRRRSVAIVVGHTLGHVLPGLAVGEAYRRALGDVDLLVIEAAPGSVTRMLPPGPWRHATVRASPLVGVGWGRKVAALGRALAAAADARRLLTVHGARLVLGFGAYASGGVLVAARSLGLGTAIHEANVIPGLANRLLAPLVDRVYLAFAPARRGLLTRRCLVVGHPVRAAIAALARERRLPPDSDRPRRLLVTTGAGAGEFFAHHAPTLAAALGHRGLAVEVVHQAGSPDPALIRHAYAAAGITASVTPHLEDIAAADRWADFALARAGAGTVSELAIAGVPALLVRSPRRPGTIRPPTPARRPPPGAPGGSARPSGRQSPWPTRWRGSSAMRGRGWRRPNAPALRAARCRRAARG